MSEKEKPKKVCLICKKGIFRFKSLPKHLETIHYMTVEHYLQMYQITAEEIEYISPKSLKAAPLVPEISPLPVQAPAIDMDEYCRTQKAKLRKEFDYPDGPILDEVVYIMGMNHRLRESYETGYRLHGKHNPDLLKTMRENSKHINSNLSELERQVTAAEAAATDPTNEASLAALHRSTLDEAEAYIKANIGEFSFNCTGCGTVVMTGGLPHWAIIKDLEGNWVSWSTELAELVNEGIIRISHMAYALRTSVDAILICAKAREFSFNHPIHKVVEEEKLKELMLKRMI